MWTDFRILEFNNDTHIGNGRPMIDGMTYEEVNRIRKANNDPHILSAVWKPNLFIGNIIGLISVRNFIFNSSRRGTFGSASTCINEQAIESPIYSRSRLVRIHNKVV